jgi:hypothetical protein
MVYRINLDEDTLRARFLTPYEQGLPVTGGGRSIPPGMIDQVLVFETDEPVPEPGSTAWSSITTNGRDRTDDFVTGAPGSSLASDSDALAPGVHRDPTRVMIVHGRNAMALDAMRAFLTWRFPNRPSAISGSTFS